MTAASVPGRGRWWLAGLALAACAAPPQERGEAFDGLAPGIRVEAKGAEIVDGLPRITDVEQIERDPEDDDKMEITARADTAATADELTLLGQRLAIVDKTGFEDLDRAEVPRYPIAAGDPLHVKVRIRDDGELRVRTVRRDEGGDRFEIEGTVTAVDREGGTFAIGPMALGFSPRTDVDLIAPDDPLALFREDEQKSVPFTIRLADGLRAGGQLSARFEHENDRDLRDDRDRDRSELAAEAKIDLLWLLTDDGSFALFEGRAGRRERFEENAPDEDDDSASLSRAYVYWRLDDALRLQVGRQDFDEQREWLYDELLDGGRVYASLAGLDVELFAAAGREWLEEHNETEDTTTLGALVHYAVDDRHRLTAYALRRTDSTARGFEPLLVGLRSYARPSRGLGHWAELALARGEDGGRDIHGHAVDLGLLYRFDAPVRPYVYAGYAFGSGREFGSAEQGFRQSGLQDNNGKFGGVTSFRYYGEVLRPELANLEVTTLGVGVRPSASLSLDVIGHTYRLDYRANALVDADLRAAPNGRHQDIGWEVDVVLGYRVADRATLEIVAGRFEPGAAFDETDAAHRVTAQARWKF